MSFGVVASSSPCVHRSERPDGENVVREGDAGDRRRSDRRLRSTKSRSLVNSKVRPAWTSWRNLAVDSSRLSARSPFHDPFESAWNFKIMDKELRGYKAVSLEDAGTGSDGAGMAGREGYGLGEILVAETARIRLSFGGFAGPADHPGSSRCTISENPSAVRSRSTARGNLCNAVKCGNKPRRARRIRRPRGCAGVMPLLDPAIAIVALALEYLHNAGFAHRDISGNVLLAVSRVRAKMCDFGSAAHIECAAAKNLLGFSGRWQPVGTMLWMAPEMLEPPLEGATPPVGYSGDKVDVYSLGIVLWELMEWRIPWTGANISKQEVIDSVVGRNERLPLPSSCDKRLADVISAMWAASPVDRPDMGSVGRYWAVGSADDAGNHGEQSRRGAKRWRGAVEIQRGAGEPY